MKKLAQSYALDALDGYEPEKDARPLKGKVTQFLANCLGLIRKAGPRWGWAQTGVLKTGKSLVWG